ncbi:MAG: hypothetical protein K0R54_4496 [Clostridiaceae bacterium]|jgi:prepilin-type N-terminal cleavage/methylation domain-containing protein|nr:hypothetical protein [Clostridiaceae bacterium]
MKRGFTIIEILISMALLSMLLIAEFKVMEKYLVLYNEESKQSRSEFYSDEAVEFIDEQITQCKTISCDNNKIKFNYGDPLNNNWIKLNPVAGYLAIYYDSEFSSINNVILRGVSDFRVQTVNKVIYITIILSNNREVKRCISTEKIQ